MKKAQVVIGANFGDEAKGLVTDTLCSATGPETLVVRFNGGAQAGHTVTTPDGRRHIFGHIGSGSFMGCGTFLSRFFVCNPMIFLKELSQFQKNSPAPKIHADPRAPITTPYDMMINQCIEDSRGLKRHGSCGVGFGETIERNLHLDYSLSFSELSDEIRMRTKLEKIRQEWVPKRLRKLGLQEIPELWSARLASSQILEKFLSDTKLFLSHVHRAPLDLLRQSPNIVFEGAQGLLLDQDHGFFPHVTRSNTGLKNVLALVQEAGIDELKIWYLTRSYLTRHGAGPMPHEMPGPIYSKIEDPTNIPNKYQGHLRFGLLDADLLRETIWRDIRQIPVSVKFTCGLSVSCMDQIDDDARYVAQGCPRSLSPEAFLIYLQRETEVTAMIASYGPSRQDVRNVPINQPLGAMAIPASA